MIWLGAVTPMDDVLPLALTAPVISIFFDAAVESVTPLTALMAPVERSSLLVKMKSVPALPVTLLTLLEALSSFTCPFVAVALTFSELKEAEALCETLPFDEVKISVSVPPPPETEWLR